MALIRVNNLIKTFGEGELITRVIRGVSFEITQGEFVAIMGPSGSGKSTLMHILGLLDKQTGGEYQFEETDTMSLDDAELARLRNEEIGFVFQSFNLLPRTTVLENVLLPLSYSTVSRRKHRARAEKVLEQVGLSHRLDYYTNQISGGEKQRVAIARALVNKPSVIFADEPTGNLDSKTGAQIMDLLQKLNDEGNTIILVTHETYTAECARRIIDIRDGEIANDRAVQKRRKASDGGLVK